MTPIKRTHSSISNHQIVTYPIKFWPQGQYLLLYCDPPFGSHYFRDNIDPRGLYFMLRSDQTDIFLMSNSNLLFGVHILLLNIDHQGHFCNTYYIITPRLICYRKQWPWQSIFSIKSDPKIYFWCNGSNFYHKKMTHVQCLTVKKPLSSWYFVQNINTGHFLLG